MSPSPSARLLLLLIASCAALMVWNLMHRHAQSDLRVTFLDVGQGDAAVIESPSGKVVVVDTGGVGHHEGDDEGRRVVGPFLRYEGIDAIDALILTHPHADHIGGASYLLRRFAVGLLEDNGQITDSSEEASYLREAHGRQTIYRAARPGQTLDCGDGVVIRVLAPTEAETQGAPNNASVVLRIEYGHTAFLLTGDAEAAEEDDLLRSGQPLSCDVLKAGHHGSNTSTTSGFLASVHPRCAVLSVGAHNLYGHPSPDVVARLLQNGVQVLRTDRNGAVTCLSDGASIHVTPYRTAAH